ncbi:MAG: SGNH/GDSL hydrolase family protein [Bacteroidales bacterium]|nr:SGNH/GDSL hydrolase family protein [Bacteroidales bacterium]
MISRLAKALVTMLLLCIATTGYSQIRWMDPLEEGAEVHGQGWESLCHSYVRLPDEAEGKVRDALWKLSRNSAGLSLVFRSNASEIRVRYQTTSSNYAMWHMASMGVSGVDMFAVENEGRELWAAPDFTPQFRDTIYFRYSGLTYQPDSDGTYEYHLYLPLYNSIKWLELGIPEGSEINFIRRSSEKPIVIYGTSIAQGACASRAGQAWGNMLGRRIGHPVVNLGFSGNGKLDPELFDLLNQIDARMYIIDCMPNNTPDMPIYERVTAGVRKLRASHDCDIILVEHSGYSNEYTKKASSSYRLSNLKLQEAYQTLIDEGVTNLHYMTHDEVGYTMDEMVEGVHPNDLGMMHTASAYEKRIRSILNE